MQRAKFSLASVLWLFAASAALAQTNDVSPNGAGVVSLEDNFSGTASLGQGAYIDVRNMAGSGVGYRNGYTQVGGFIPLWGSDDWFIAPQARLIITDTQRIGGNLGLVGRRYVSDWDRIIGANLFYDFDESYLNNRYNQVGFGFETLGEWLDVRGNVYLPTGGETNNMGPAGLDSTLYYIQNRLAVRGYDLIEQSLKGGDVEFGVPVLPSTPWLRAFAGAYFYDGDGHDPVGVRGRIDANISNDLLVGLNVTHDNVYGTNLNAVVDFRFSGFLPTRYFPNWTTQERMLTQVQRNWRIATDQYLISKDIPVINPRDDQPYFVVHIDSNNTGAGTGDGTAENPYHNLPGTVPNQTDLVLVQRGQSTEAAPYTGNIQLVDYARMLGEGKAHIFDGYVNYGGYSQVYNDTVLPGFSNSGLYPFLSNPAGDIVTLASHNEVSAMVLQNASGAGIAGNGVSGFHLNNLEIAGNVGGGIVLQNAVGTGGATLDGQTISGGLIADINRNVVPGYTPPAIGVGNNAGGGIVIDTGADGLNLDITRVSMNAAAPGTQTVGIQLTADDGNLSVILDDVQTRGNSSAGIQLNQTGGTTLAATMTTVDVSANAGDGLQINGDGGTTVVGTTLTPVNGLLADDNAGRGIAISGANAAQIGVALSGGSTQRSGDDGLFITGAGAGTVVDVSVIGNNLTDSGQTVAGAAAVDLSALAGADVTLTMSNTPAGFTTNANDDSGLMVTANAGTATANVTNGNFNNAGVDAVSILGTALGTANVSLTGTGGSDAGNDGIHAVADGGTVNLEVTGSSAVPASFNGAGVNGFDGLAQNGGTLNMCLEYTTFNGSGDVGMTLLADGVDAMTSSLISANLDNVQVNGSQLGGLAGTADNFGELRLRAVASQFDGNGLGAASDGVLITADNSGRALTLFSNSSASGNSDDGFSYVAGNGAYMSARLDAFTATGNAGYGVNFNATGAGTDAYLITETASGANSVSGNTLGNYNLAFTNTGDAVAALTGSFNGSGGDGVNISITGDGTGTALVSLTGDGTTDTIDGNAGNGVNISIQNEATAGVSVTGYTSISNNGADGIHVALQDIFTAAAVDLRGIPTTLTTMTDNGDDGVEVDLTNVVLGLVGGAAGNVDVLSLTDNDPNNICLPAPALMALNTVVAAPTANGVLIDSYNINNTSPPNPGQDGIIVIGNAVSGTGGITISNNIDPNMEDGIQVNLTNNSTPAFISIHDNQLSEMTQNGIIVTADGGSSVLDIFNNTVTTPGDTGIAVELTNLANYNLGIDSNTVQGALLNEGIRLALDGGAQLSGVNSISDNAVSDGASDGVLVSLDNATIAALQMLQNSVITNADNGLVIRGVNGSAITTVLIDGSEISDNRAGDGVLVDLTDSGVTGGITISNSSISNNALNGINFELDNAPIASVDIIDNNVGQSFAAGTLDFSFNNLIWTTLVDNNAGSTVDIASVSIDLTPTGQVWRPDLTPLVAQGFQPQGGSDVTVGLTAVNGTLVTAGTDPLEDIFNNVIPGGGLATTDPFDQVITLDFNDFNPGEQLNYSLSHALPTTTTGSGLSGVTLAGAIGTVTLADGRTVSGVLTSSGLDIVQSFAASSNGISNNGLDGVRVNQTNGSDIANLNIDGNVIAANGTNGVELLVSSSDLGATMVTENQIRDHANGDGFRMVGPSDTSNAIDLAFARNTIDSNTGGRGVNIDLTGSPNATNVTASFTNDSITNNGQEGINFNLANNGVASGTTGTLTITSDNVTPNPVSGLTHSQINGNGGAGVLINTAGASSYTLNVGGTGTANEFSNNGGPGLLLEMAGSGASTATIANSTFASNVDAGIGVRQTGSTSATINMTGLSLTGTTDGGDVDFAGEGFKAILRSQSVLTGSLAGSTITGNAGDGVHLNATGNNAGVFSTITDFTIGGLTPDLGNTITGNGVGGVGNGISVLRTADAQIDLIGILNNTVTGNTGNGLYILAANANKIDDYTINSNSFSSNARDGVLFDVRADAAIDANMDLNVISGNGLNGIHTIEQVNAGADLRSVDGTWTRNTITSNGQNGIFLEAAMGNYGGLLIGDLSDQLQGNAIGLNAASGVHITGPGTVTVGSNLIMENGTLSELGTANEDAGVYINVRPFSDVTLVNNDIENNRGDGVQYGMQTGFSGFFSRVSITDNVISSNAGRGIDLINRASNVTNAEISGNRVNSNGLEGVYIINTASTTQNQFDSSNVALLTNGSIFNNPILRLQFNGNEVRSNGINSPASTTGFWLRVGTSGGGSSSSTTPGSFVSDGGFGQNALSENALAGGVIASMYDNTFGGNFGNDIQFASFVSTGDPAATAGTWGDTQNPTVGPTTYQSDPLSRLDLYFDNNAYESQDVNNSSGISTANPTNVAFYDNSEGTFKSRLNTTNPGANQGPFTSATRRRNATRLAGAFPDADSQPNGTSFLYPGVGASTFRVDTTDGSFFIDDTPFPYTGFIWGGSITGEVPYSWGTLP
ncbi:right-handed parallel beta-helix repeat-containing protein [Planctellipticum variicoloris]|uniref:right-handed parallel beta-helix repeat-containing protein n=1 Tax=Planctellipticum variicoloris TaxID=3064265 RepID=UPI003013F9E7|nr:right-handed parallel beta-helix repeat-containing protein [Planctomycetaceae bacterium SH412]